MSAKTVDVLPRVYAQLREQQDYFLIQEPGEAGKALAERFAAAVDAQIEKLRDFPEIGARFRFRLRRSEPLRWVSVPGFRQYLIFYRYSKSDGIALVVNLRHGSMDLQSVLDED